MYMYVCMYVSFHICTLFIKFFSASVLINTSEFYENKQISSYVYACSSLLSVHVIICQIYDDCV